MIFTGGVIGWDEQERLVADDLVGQFRQVLKNILAILAEGGAGPEHLVRLTWYITDRDAYLASLAEIGTAWRDHMGRNYPAMAVVAVSSLMESAARIEIEATAVLPPAR
jgi:enamine deaminase RidA (YjgF/YER057c/UK114 family)